MTVQSDRRRRLGNIFMVAGLLLVLIAGISYGWSAVQGALLRARLRNLAPERPAGMMAQAPATQRPTDAGALLPTPRVTPSPTNSPTAPATPGPTLSQAPTGLPPTATATPTPAPTDTPTPTPTPSPTSIPPSPPVRLVIADLHISTKVDPMGWHEVKTKGGVESEWDIPENTAGHAINSARLGENGNVVIVGHNNIYGRVFMSISEAWGGEVENVDKVTERSHLLDGRLITLDAADGRRFYYTITDFLRVQDSGVPLAQRVDNAQYIEPTGDARLTIITCWPPWGNTHRLILVAKPAYY